MVDVPAEGRRVGRYLLYDEIASGGMATVHLARLVGPESFSRTVAIKRAYPQFAKDQEFVAKFLEEARLAARITHRNVVPTLDVVADEGEVLLVMEYVSGESLSRLRRASETRGVRVPLPIACSIMSDLLHGLHAAHEATDEHGQRLEIVHRDVSPHNVLVGRDGTTRVLDFGVAKAASSAQTTKDGHVKGKLSYMAPEQLAGRPIDRRADVFAAGIIFWELLAGRRLFEGTDHGAIVTQILFTPIEPPSRHAEFPAALDAIVVKALAVEPAKRFQTAEQMARAIEAAMPLATPAQVGDWVEDLMGDVLRDRAARAKRIEVPGPSSARSQDDTVETAPPEDVPTAPTMTVNAMPNDLRVRVVDAFSEPAENEGSVAPTPRGERRRRLPLPAIATGVFGVALVAVGVAVLSARYEARRDVVPSVVVDPPATSATASVVSVPIATSSAPASASVVAQPTEPPSPRRPERAVPATRPHARGRCSPNYYFDDAGLKRFKRECL